MDLCSINYLHFGKPKHWYAISESDNEKFENLIKKHFSEQLKKCDQYIRHKSILINPEVLLSNNISVFKCIQNPGEYVVTKPSVYHMGFNYGINCAEAVNFATSKWISYCNKADVCKCGDDIVYFPADYFIRNLGLNKTDKNSEAIDNCCREAMKIKELESIAKEVLNKNINTENSNINLLKKAKNAKKSKEKLNEASTSPSLENKEKLPKEFTNRKGIKNPYTTGSSKNNRTLETWLECSLCKKWRKIKGKHIILY